MWPKNLECRADLQCGKSIMAMLEFKYVPDVADHMITEEGLDTLENWGGELGRAGHHCQRWGSSGWNSKIDEWKECSELHPRWIASFEISPLMYLVSFQFSSSHISIMTYFYHSDAFIMICSGSEWDHYESGSIPATTLPCLKHVAILWPLVFWCIISSFQEEISFDNTSAIFQWNLKAGTSCFLRTHALVITLLESNWTGI